MNKRRIIIAGLAIAASLFFAPGIFSYTTHSGELSLDGLSGRIQLWLKEAAPEDVSTDAYNMKTHPWLTLRAIELFEEQSGVILPVEAKEQILLGSIEEDYDITGISTVGDYSHLGTTETLFSLMWGSERIIVNVNRSENHFMNYDGDTDGLNNGLGVDTERNTSALKWAKDDERNLTNFEKAVAGGSWRHLGHVLHLLEDMSVPAHVRNDAHVINRDGYEKYLERMTPHEYSLLTGGGAAPLRLPLTAIDALFNGLSGYTRNRYFSDDTVFKDNMAGIALPQAGYTMEDSAYFYDAGGRRIAHKGLAFWALYWSRPSGGRPLGETDYGLVRQAASINEEVAKDMFSDLGLQAASYGAELINIFYNTAFPVRQ
jgi:hypothetical protein